MPKADKEGEGRGNLVVLLVVIKWGVSLDIKYSHYGDKWPPY